jgi:hypothetical protein
VFALCGCEDDAALVTWAAGGTSAAAAQDHVSIRVVTGDRHWCSLGNDDRVKCWEPDTSGSGRDVGLKGVLELASGPTHVCVSDQSHHVYCWARGEEPTRVSGLESGRRLVVSGDAACALDLEDNLWCWGVRQDGVSEPEPVPVVRPPGTIRALRGGQNTLSVLYEDGYLWLPKAWSQQRGITFAVEASDFASSVSHDCVLMSIGSVYCTVPGSRHFVYDWEGPTNLVGLGAGDLFSCGLEGDGSVFCTGTNELGQLGDGTRGTHSTWSRVVTVPPALELSVGRSHACARTEKGAVWCWGQVPGHGEEASPVELVPGQAEALPEAILRRLPASDVGAFVSAVLQRGTALCECETPDPENAALCTSIEGAVFNLRCLKATDSESLRLGCHTSRFELLASCARLNCADALTCDQPECNTPWPEAVCSRSCNDGSSLGADKVCDGVADCPDASDEMFCSAP